MQQGSSKTTVERFWHLRKQSCSIDSTPDFTITSPRAWQEAKQDLPTVLTDEGIQIRINESQKPKAELPRTEMQECSSKTTVKRFWHLSKQPSPIDSTPGFTITAHRPSQELKQSAPTALMVGGRQIDKSDEQSRNAESPRTETRQFYSNATD
jgi:hypothetical protein